MGMGSVDVATPVVEPDKPSCFCVEAVDKNSLEGPDAAGKVDFSLVDDWSPADWRG